MKSILAVVSVCCILYGAAFVAIHSFPVFRHPAANLSYWYYSDNDVIEAIEFYGFWPLRQVAYRLGILSRHNDERIWEAYPPASRVGD